jgi:ribosome-associated protein
LKTLPISKNVRKTTINSQQLLDLIADSILDKKGEDVISLDLTKLHDAMADYFVICEGNSPPQVRAIAENIVERVKKTYNILPATQEGFNSMEWVLLDYLDIVIHIFHKSKRHVYQLEELWGDAITTTYNPDGTKFTKQQHKSFLPKAE